MEIIKAFRKGVYYNVMIDEEDYDELSKYKWYISKYGYVITCIRVKGTDKKEAFIMHILIMKAPKGIDVDHSNYNKLDNRKENLRLCTHLKNTQNRKHGRGKSKYKGVSLDTRLKYKKWRATIVLDKKQICIGYFLTEEEAGLAYNEKAKELFGEFACLNIISE